MQIGVRRLRTPHVELPHLPRPRNKFAKVLRAVLPLVIIALAVYAVYNFPALKAQIDYWVHKPKPGNVHLLPATTRNSGGEIPVGNNSSGEIPVGNNLTCGKPIPYDNNGNPQLICDNYVYIPKIRIAAPIVYTKSTSDDVINQDLLKGVVHYPGTAEPGQIGNVFLTGHSSYYWWVNSDYKTIFTLVPQLVGGDEIVIYSKGIRYTYRVNEIKEVVPNDVSVLRPTTDPVVTLSTCVPIGTSYHRKIVRAVQVSPDPKFARPSGSNTLTPGRLPGVR